MIDNKFRIAVTSERGRGIESGRVSAGAEILLFFKEEKTWGKWQNVELRRKKSSQVFIILFSCTDYYAFEIFNNLGE